MADITFVGSNVTILNDVRIGSNSIIAAGAVVTKDVPENCVVGGVPGRVICIMDDYLEKKKDMCPKELAPEKTGSFGKVGKLDVGRI